MSLESLTPTEYQKAYEAYAEEHGYHARNQAVPRLSLAIASSPAASGKLLQAATQEAEELLGASASDAFMVEAALEEGGCCSYCPFPG